MARRRKHSENEKAKIVLEVLKGELTTNEIVGSNGVVPGVLKIQEF